MALRLGTQTYQIVTNNDYFCIPSLSSILLAVTYLKCLDQGSWPLVATERIKVSIYKEVAADKPCPLLQPSLGQ